MFVQYDYIYRPAERLIKENCTLEELCKYYNTGYRYKHLPNSSTKFIITKPAIHCITRTENGIVTKIFPSRSFIFNRYKLKNLTERSFLRIVNDLTAGKLKFDEIY